MKTGQRTIILVVLASLSLAPAQADAQREAEGSSTTVIGPRNVYLADGATALMNGEAERGVEMTEKGLELARGAYERKIGLSNLCAGYLMIGKPEEALDACNRVLEEDPNYWRAYNNRALVLIELGFFEESEADIERGQALRPGSKNLKLTRARLLDATDPVVPIVEIDERRIAGEEDAEDDNME